MAWWIYGYIDRLIDGAEAVSRGVQGGGATPLMFWHLPVIFKSVDNVSTLLDKCFNIVIYV